MEEIKGTNLLFDMLLHSPLTGIIVHEIPGKEITRSLLRFDHLLSVFCIDLLLWQIDNCDIGTFSGHQDCNRSPDSGTMTVNNNRGGNDNNASGNRANYSRQISDTNWG